MAKKVKGAQLVFEVTDDGSLKLLEGKLKGTKKATDNLSKSEQTLNRNFKGASQQSSNTTKNFSKMAQGITGGLVPAYATLAANVFAIGAAFRFLQDAANYRILIEGQREYATVTGESLKLLTSRLQEATGQQLAFAEAAQSVAIARAAGVTTDQINRLGVLAKNASIALGRDLTDSLNRLVRGVTKAEPELLDELGIILRLETAAEKYGAKIGKAAKDLNIFEKSQAVVNEVLSQGEEKFGEFTTELNAFSKLAKSFDDLINRIKSSLTGLAEFMAKGLSKNVVALGGAFALLGSGILKAITPEVPDVDVGAGAKAAQADVGKFYTGSKARAKRFKTGAFSATDLDALEKSVNNKKSTVMNFENMSRSEAQRTVAILKAGYIQTEAAHKGMLGKMLTGWKATLYLMQAEYGRFVGVVKFLGLQLSRAIGALGWIGLIVSAIGIVAQLMDKFKDPAAVEFEETTTRLVRSLREQNKELGYLNSNLKETKTQLSAVTQLANFFANFSFAGTSEAFQPKALKKARFAGFFEKAGERRNELTGGQVDIINQTIDSLRLQQSQLKEGTDEYDEIEGMISIFNQSLIESASAAGINSTAFEVLRQTFVKLETDGTSAQDRISKFSSTTNILTSSITEVSNALAKLRTPSTGLSVITKNMGDFGDAIKTIGEELKDSPFKKLGDEFKTAFDDTTLEAMKQFLGKDVVENLMKAAAGNNVEAFNKIGAAIMAESERLHEFEIRMLTEKQNLQNQYLNQSIGATKLVAAQIKRLEKVALLESEISITQQYRQELIKAGLEENAVAIAQETAKIKNMEARLKIAQREADLLMQVGDTFRNSFESGMATAFQAIIEGTKSVKEAFGEMAKMILQSLAQILAQQAAMTIMTMLPAGFGVFPGARSGGIMNQGAGGGYRSFAGGGIGDGPDSGYTATLHGTEAVVPLGNDRAIPVKFENGGQGGGNVTVNVNMTTGESTTTGEDAYTTGRAIAQAVQNEIARQQRPGGSLSPY